MNRTSSPFGLHRATATARVQPAATIAGDWTRQLPLLAGPTVALRELELDDAASLLTMITADEVQRFVSPPPATVQEFEKQIAWTKSQRQIGKHACFGIVPAGLSTVVGVFQIRSLEPGFHSGEWGFMMSSAFWGTGVFAEAAQLVLEFAFDTVNIHRLEARAVVANGRGNGALRKLGAVQEGILRRSFLKDGRHIDQVLWSILAEDWRLATTDRRAAVVH